MYRVLAVLLALVASTVVSSAQGLLLPSVWQSDRGAILKVLWADPATGNFTGVFINGPDGPCPGVPYRLAGRMVDGRVAFETSRDWTLDCRATTVWSGRFVGPATVATRGVTTYVGPDGRVVRARGTSVFQRL
ncbi:MAG: hypothetical protein IT537_23745 [Hyphomicrobiales bacterium]|nr:hypothetical protein [Hyphomicrobiales bacterium]